MSDFEDSDAWNNFLINSQPEKYPANSMRRAAALAKNYMNGVESGGINSFLTNNWELDGDEILQALTRVGAAAAAEQFAEVLQRLGIHITPSTQDARWRLLDASWPRDADNDCDMLSFEAGSGLMQALESHVNEEKDFYRSLSD